MLIGSLSRRGIRASILSSGSGGSAPVNSVPPVIVSDGDILNPHNGDILSVSSIGTWPIPGDPTNQWFFDTAANPIVGETGGTYVIGNSSDVTGHVIGCAVTETNAFGSTTAISNLTGVVS